MSRAFAPVLARHQTSALVTVLSVLAWLSLGSGYEVSKSSGVVGRQHAARPARRPGTLVTAVHVGYIDTHMTAGLAADVENSIRATLPARRPTRSRPATTSSWPTSSRGG